jgi:hypothetical protein
VFTKENSSENEKVQRTAGILPGTPLAIIEAFLDEALVYGKSKRKMRINE